MAWVEAVKEIIQTIKEKNNKYCTDKIDQIEKVLQPFIDDVKNNIKQDDAIMITLYIRKWNDIASNGYCSSDLWSSTQYDRFVYNWMAKINNDIYNTGLE